MGRDEDVFCGDIQVMSGGKLILRFLLSFPRRRESSVHKYLLDPPVKPEDDKYIVGV